VADRQARDERARLRILEAYERAKGVDPSITQGQFMRAGAPGSRVEGLIGRFRSDDTAARYFRKIRSGERTGGAMYRQGTEEGPGRNIGLFQIKTQIGPDRFISQNITVAGGRSTFDYAAIESEIRLNHRAEMMRIIRAYRDKYGIEQEEIDLDAIEARTIRHQRKPIRMHLGLDWPADPAIPGSYSPSRWARE